MPQKMVGGNPRKDVVTRSRKVKRQITEENLAFHSLRAAGEEENLHANRSGGRKICKKFKRKRGDFSPDLVLNAGLIKEKLRRGHARHRNARKRAVLKRQGRDRGRG